MRVPQHPECVKLTLEVVGDQPSFAPALVRCDTWPRFAAVLFHAMRRREWAGGMSAADAIGEFYRSPDTPPELGLALARLLHLHEHPGPRRQVARFAAGDDRLWREIMVRAPVDQCECEAS